MPAVSAKQRAWAFGVKGKAWARRHHYDNAGPLPARTDRRGRMIRQFQQRHRRHHG
jgi:hypothetical protein